MPSQHQAKITPPPQTKQSTRRALQPATADPATTAISTWGRNTEAELGNSTSDSIPSMTKKFIRMVSSGEYHTVALDSISGQVLTWGRGWEGELGNGTIDTYSVPMPLPYLALPSRATAVAAGGFHSMALVDGGVWTWGANWWGQLGDGSTAQRLSPVNVLPAGSNITAITGGDHHSLALRADGTVWAWGDNWAGQLGDGTTTMRTRPVQVQGLSGIHIVAIAANGHHNLALSDAGDVYTWGWNDLGQLGLMTSSCNGVNLCSSIPLRVTGIGGGFTGGSSHVTSIAAGFYHSLVLADDGNVWGWGSDANGQLLNNDIYGSQPKFNPLPLTAPFYGYPQSGVTAIAGGLAHSLFQYSDRVIGLGDSSRGELGNGFTTSTDQNGNPHPDQALLPLPPARVSSGMGARSFAILSDGSLWGWGDDDAAELGHGVANGGNSATGVPQTAALPAEPSAVAAGQFFDLALLQDGTVWGWGGNWSGQLGNGTTIAQLSPSRVGLSGHITAVGAGAAYGFAIDDTGSAWGWGDNQWGQLGNGTISLGSYTTTPTHTVGLTGLVAIGGGIAHTVALRNDGSVWAWGANLNDEVGQPGGSTDPQCSFCFDTPQQVNGLSTPIVAIASGWTHTLALGSDGTVWAWGDNSYGQLGIGSSPPHSPPVRVPGLSNVVALGAGSSSSSSYAVRADGTLWAWGRNTGGQLGQGDNAPRYSPVQVGGLPGVHIVAVTSGSGHALARDDQGRLWVWGANWSGQLGEGTLLDHATPVLMPYLTGLHQVAAGDSGSVGF